MDKDWQLDEQLFQTDVLCQTVDVWVLSCLDGHKLMRSMETQVDQANLFCQAEYLSIMAVRCKWGGGVKLILRN